MGLPNNVGLSQALPLDAEITREENYYRSFVYFTVILTRCLDHGGPPKGQILKIKILILSM